jgi:hypothetical protein
MVQDDFGGLNEQQFESLFRSLFGSRAKVKKMWYQKSFLHQLDKGFR